MVQWLRIRICTTKWSVLPDWLWFLVASPLLRWAFGRSPGGKWWQGWFTWPRPG